MNWLRNHIADTVIARRAEPGDRSAVAALLAQTWRQQGVTAVEEQAALLNSGLSAVAWADRKVVGFLGVMPRTSADLETDRWADVGLIAVATDQPLRDVLPRLMAAVLPAFHDRQVTRLACLTAERWVKEGLALIGFAEVDQVIGYVRPQGRPLPIADPVADLRVAGPADADTVLALNAAAFEPLWRYDDAKVLGWLLTADHAVLAERNGRPVGFALSVSGGRDSYAHLVRVAVHPAEQGRGIGRQLVADAVRYAAGLATVGLALNTQASNLIARRLYSALGFEPGGPTVSVLVWPGRAS